jgi:tripartite-type tricarboxylate transporter receptor subunit TctC
MRKIIAGIFFMLFTAMSWATSHNIEIWVPQSSGGISGKYAFLLQKKLSDYTSGTVTINFKPGADGLLGIRAMTAQPRRNTIDLLIANDRIPVSMYLSKQLPESYSQLLQPIAFLGYSEYILHVPADSPVNSIQDLDTLGKTHLNFANVGNGSWGHLVQLIIQPHIKTELSSIYYPGNSKALTDVAGKHADITTGFVSDSLQFVTSGRTKAIAISSKNIPIIGNIVPTFAEQKINNMPPGSFFAVFVNQQIAPDQLAWIQDTINRLLITNSTEWQSSMNVTAPTGDQTKVISWWRTKMAWYKNLANDPRFAVMQK